MLLTSCSVHASIHGNMEHFDVAIFSGYDLQNQAAIFIIVYIMKECGMLYERSKGKY